MVLLLAIVAAPLIVLMSGRGRGGRGGGGGGRNAGRGLGRGQGMVPLRGIVWKPKGPHAAEILRGYLRGDADYTTWDSFKRSHASWILSPFNLDGYYLQDNLRRNYEKTIQRYHDTIDPNNPYDAGYSDEFLAAIGAPGLPAQNPQGINFTPGDDGGEYDANREEVPAGQVLPAAPETNVEEEEEEEEEEGINADLEQQIQDLTSAVAGVEIDMSSNIIPCKAFRAPAIKLKGMDRDDISNALGVICFLGSGTVLSSIDIDLRADQQSFDIKGHLAIEMGTASHLLPGYQIFRNNPTIFEPLKQAVQTVLNESEVDDASNPVLKGSGKLIKKAVGGVLPLHKLYLVREKTAFEKQRGELDDFWMIHPVPIHGPHADSTIPAYVAVCFFQEEMVNRSAKKQFIRKVPLGLTMPDGSPPPLFPDSPRLMGTPTGASNPETPRSKRRREEEEAAAAAAMDTTDGGGATIPDDSSSGGFGSSVLGTLTGRTLRGGRGR